MGLLNHGPMIGMYTKPLILSLFLFTLLACSKQQVEYKSLKNSFSSNYNLNLGRAEQAVYFASDVHTDPLKRENLSFYLDLDGDGIVDYHDSDIDGDSFHNYIDSHPMDKDLGGEDLNHDGIIDFIFHEKYISLINAYNELGIALIIPAQKELSSELIDILQNKKLQEINQGLFAINISQIDRTKSADYNIQWKSINIYPRAMNQDPHESFIHESFHHYAQTHPDFYQDVINLIGWQESLNEYAQKEFSLASNIKLPSFYAHENPVESFAEVMTFHFTESLEINANRFIFSESYRQTALYDELNHLIFETLF